VGGFRRTMDVFIIGGGPAGLAAAIAARKKGFEVIVADSAEPPIKKTCGEGMMPETLSALESLGVKIKPQDGQMFRGICFMQEGARTFADFPQGHGIGLRRKLLHERLIRRAEECDVTLLWKTPVVGIDSERVRISHGEVGTQWIVGADGQGSRVRRWSGLDATQSIKKRYARRRHYRVKPWSCYVELHWGRHAQAYVTPIASEEVCIVITSERAECTSFDRALQELPNLRKNLFGAEPSSRERGSVTSTHVLRNVQRTNLALAGDAAGGVDAITGDGLRLAFLQASALADSMAVNDLTQYQQAHRQFARHPVLMGNLLLWLGRNPSIRARVIRALQNNPNLFARLLATHVGHGNSVELLSTGALLSWRLLTT
jgi:flavin-dependent dehydrogenase